MKNYWKNKEHIQNFIKVSSLRLKAGIIFLWLAFALQIAARTSSIFANWYTTTIYPFWVNTIGRFWSFVPFSVVEVLLYGLIGIALKSAIFGIVHFFQKKKTGKELLLRGGRNVIFVFGTLFFLYTSMCGVNYYSEAFSEKNQIKVIRYSVEELYAYCKEITKEVNACAESVDEKLLADLERNEKEAVKAMKKLGNEYLGLSGYYPKPKKVIVSEILSLQQLTGVYSPFTVEANYNADMEAYNLPFTMCHELSHLRGFMREDEANYIAYLACSHSENKEFQYSGAMMAWIYSTNILYQYDPEAYRELHQSLLPKVKKDLRKNTLFWDRYDGKLAEAANQMNDTYLKANNQTDGVLSYDRMVDLLMTEYLLSHGSK